MRHLLVAHSHSTVAGPPICISGSTLTEWMGEGKNGGGAQTIISNLIDHASKLTVIRMVDNTLTSAATLSRVAATVAR